MQDISEQTLQKIIDLTTENVLLKIPDVVGNLITHHIAMNKVNKDFYEKHPDLREHKETVASVIEYVEGNNSPMDYSQLIEKAYPEIRKRLALTKDLDMKTAKPPELTYNGEI